MSHFSEYDQTFNSCYEETLLELQHHSTILQNQSTSDELADESKDESKHNEYKDNNNYRAILRCEMKFEFLNMLQERLILPMDDFVFIHNNKYLVISGG
eukprot:320353_1